MNERPWGRTKLTYDKATRSIIAVRRECRGPQWWCRARRVFGHEHRRTAVRYQDARFSDHEKEL